MDTFETSTLAIVVHQFMVREIMSTFAEGWSIGLAQIGSRFYICWPSGTSNGLGWPTSLSDTSTALRGRIQRRRILDQSYDTPAERTITKMVGTVELVFNQTCDEDETMAIWGFESQNLHSIISRKSLRKTPIYSSSNLSYFFLLFYKLSRYYFFQIGDL